LVRQVLGFALPELRRYLLCVSVVGVALLAHQAQVGQDKQLPHFRHLLAVVVAAGLLAGLFHQAALEGL